MARHARRSLTRARSWWGSLKAYFAATIGLLLVMFPVMIGMTGLDTHHYQGLLQRIFALTVFPPVAVGAFVLAQEDSDGNTQELGP